MGLRSNDLVHTAPPGRAHRDGGAPSRPAPLSARRQQPTGPTPEKVNALPRPASRSGFVFFHHESDGLLAWPRYKLKECWALVLCLLQMRALGEAVVVHNWWTGPTETFSRQFRDRRAAAVDPRLADAPVVVAHAAGVATKILAFALAALLFLVPLPGLVALTRLALSPRIAVMVIYADGQLSGHVLSRAAGRRGIATYTLQHGLYRNDDSGAVMMIWNFVSDAVCLWDRHTQASFAAAGIPPDRTIIVGEYGFKTPPEEQPRVDTLVILCPPYDREKLPVFRDLEASLPPGTQTVWSLHPLLRAEFPELKQAPIAEIGPRPGLAISGDSGALMNALARDIPILTVSERQLSQTGLTLDEARTVETETLAHLINAARKSLPLDRKDFGFDD